MKWLIWTTGYRTYGHGPADKIHAGVYIKDSENEANKKKSQLEDLGFIAQVYPLDPKTLRYSIPANSNSHRIIK